MRTKYFLFHGYKCFKLPVYFYFFNCLCFPYWPSFIYCFLASAPPAYRGKLMQPIGFKFTPIQYPDFTVSLHFVWSGSFGISRAKVPHVFQRMENIVPLCFPYPTVEHIAASWISPQAGMLKRGTNLVKIDLHFFMLPSRFCQCSLQICQQAF